MQVFGIYIYIYTTDFRLTYLLTKLFIVLHFAAKKAIHIKFCWINCFLIFLTCKIIICVFNQWILIWIVENYFLRLYIQAKMNSFSIVFHRKKKIAFRRVKNLYYPALKSVLKFDDLVTYKQHYICSTSMLFSGCFFFSPSSFWEAFINPKSEKCLIWTLYMRNYPIKEKGPIRLWLDWVLFILLENVASPK